MTGAALIESETRGLAMNIVSADRTLENNTARLTWQVTLRNNITGSPDLQTRYRRRTATSGLAEPPRASPEAVDLRGRSLFVNPIATADIDGRRSQHCLGPDLTFGRLRLLTFPADIDF